MEELAWRKEASIDHSACIGSIVVLICGTRKRRARHGHETYLVDGFVSGLQVQGRNAAQDSPVLADSRIPNGLSKLKNAFTRLGLAVSSTMIELSLTSTILPRNWDARVEIDWRCWCLRWRASEGVSGSGLCACE